MGCTLSSRCLGLNRLTFLALDLDLFVVVMNVDLTQSRQISSWWLSLWMIDLFCLDLAQSPVVVSLVPL